MAGHEHVWRRWVLRAGLWLVLVIPVVHGDVTRLPGGDPQWPGAASIVVGLVTVLVVAVRAMLMNRWGWEGAVASVFLFLPTFAFLAASVMAVPVTEHTVWYPLIHPVWMFLVLGSLAFVQWVLRPVEGSTPGVPRAGDGVYSATAVAGPRADLPG